jgi:hypothetical protein
MRPGHPLRSRATKAPLPGIPLAVAVHQNVQAARSQASTLEALGSDVRAPRWTMLDYPGTMRCKHTTARVRGAWVVTRSPPGYTDRIYTMRAVPGAT